MDLTFTFPEVILRAARQKVPRDSLNLLPEAPLLSQMVDDSRDTPRLYPRIKKPLKDPAIGNKMIAFIKNLWLILKGKTGRTQQKSINARSPVDTGRAVSVILSYGPKEMW